MLNVKRSMLCVSGLLILMHSHAADDGRLEMWEEPSHQLVFERQDTRILDIRIVPGVTSEFHKHRFATVYIVIQDALLQGQEYGQEWTARVDRPYRAPGGLADRADYVAKNSYHRVKNNDDKTFHLLSIVNSATPPSVTEPDSANDRKAYLSNEWFAEHRITLESGASSKELLFANDTVLVQSHKGLAYVLENGITHSIRSVPGAWSFHAAGSRFKIVNDSQERREFILIEVKG